MTNGELQTAIDRALSAYKNCPSDITVKLRLHIEDLIKEQRRRAQEKNNG